MSHYVTLTPIYGRDYKSASAIKADYDSGRDFTLNDWGNRYDGKPINKEQVEQAGYKVTFRYNNNRSTCTL